MERLEKRQFVTVNILVSTDRHDFLQKILERCA